MMKKFSLLLILALVMSFQSTVVATCFQGANQKKATEEDLIRQTLTDYIEGSTNGQPKRLQKAFHLNLNLYSTKNGKLSIWPGTDYIKDTKEGKPTGETGKILSIDFENDAAVAKVEIAHPRSPTPYIDYFMLLKLEGKWTIIHKMFTKKTSKPNARKGLTPKTETPDAGYENESQF